MITPRVAIVMPVTRIELVPDAIASVVSQTHTNWKLFLVADKVDGLCKLEKDLKELIRLYDLFTHTRAEIIMFPKKGKEPKWGQVRNYACEEIALLVRKQHERFTHIAFLDDDDIWFPDHLEIALQAFGNESIGHFSDSFVVTSFFKVPAQFRLRAVDWTRDQFIENCMPQSGTQPYLSMMRILNPDTFTASALVIPIAMGSIDWPVAYRRDDRPLPGEDLRLIQSYLLNEYQPIWVKSPSTLANLNYPTQNYVGSGEPDEIVRLGHIPHLGPDRIPR